MDYNENFEIFSASSLEDRESRKKSGLDSSDATSMEFNVEQITYTVIKKMGQVFPNYKEKPFISYTLQITWQQWIHRESIIPTMENQPQTLGTRLVNYVGTNSFERRVNSSSF